MIPVVVPQLFAFDDPVLTRWLVERDDEVSAGQGIAALELDKAEAIVTAPAGGRVRTIRVGVGAHVVAGELLAEIDAG